MADYRLSWNQTEVQSGSKSFTWNVSATKWCHHVDCEMASRLPEAIPACIGALATRIIIMLISLNIRTYSEPRPGCFT